MVTVLTVESDSRTICWGGEVVGVGGGGLRRLCLCLWERRVGEREWEERRRDESGRKKGGKGGECVGENWEIGSVCDGENIK